MSSAKKVLLYSFEFGLLIALMIVGFNLFGRAQDTTDALSREQDLTNQRIEEYEVVKFDGYEISGSQAIYYAKEVIGKYEIPVVFKTTNLPGGFTMTNSSLFDDLRDIDSDYYVNPIVQYLVTIQRDKNDAIIQVVISYVSP